MDLNCSTSLFYLLILICGGFTFGKERKMIRRRFIGFLKKKRSSVSLKVIFCVMWNIFMGQKLFVWTPDIFSNDLEMPFVIKVGAIIGCPKRRFVVP